METTEDNKKLVRMLIKAKERLKAEHKEFNEKMEVIFELLNKQIKESNKKALKSNNHISNN